MYKIKNKLEQHVRFKDVIFAPKEVKILKDKPNSDKFNIEEIEEPEKVIKSRR